MRAPSAASCTASGTVDMQIVAVAPEQRVRLDVDGDVEIAGRAAVRADVSLARHADAARRRPARPARDASDSVRIFHACARRRPDTRVALPAGAAAARARLREHHVAARRLHHAGAVAGAARRPRRAAAGPALARAAVLLPGHRQRAAGRRASPLRTRRDRLSADRRRVGGLRSAARRGCRSTSANRSPKVDAARRSRWPRSRNLRSRTSVRSAPAAAPLRPAS